MRNAKTIDEFKSLLDSTQKPGTKKEQEIQNHLEEKAELIPTPHRLNHQLHLKAVISKFPLGNRFITDYGNYSYPLCNIKIMEKVLDRILV